MTLGELIKNNPQLTSLVIVETTLTDEEKKALTAETEGTMDEENNFVITMGERKIALKLVTQRESIFEIEARSIKKLQELVTVFKYEKQATLPEIDHRPHRPWEQWSGKRRKQNRKKH